MKISLLVPTRKRPQNIDLLISSLGATLGGVAELVLGIDESDSSYDLKKLERTKGVKIVRTPDTQYLSNIYNILFEYCSGDIIGYLSDDIKISGNVVDVFNRVVDTFTLKPNILYVFPAFDSRTGTSTLFRENGLFVPEHGLVSAKSIREIGFLMPPNLEHGYLDQYIGLLYKDYYHLDPDDYFMEHMAGTNRADDETYRIKSVDVDQNGLTADDRDLVTFLYYVEKYLDLHKQAIENLNRKDPLISIVICSRMEGNSNSNLYRLLKSIQDMTCDHDSVEVLIKFDDDDTLIDSMIKKFSKFSFKIKHCKSKRLRGYIDIHHGYGNAFKMASPSSIVVGAMADDFEIIVQDWDKILIENSLHFKDNVFFIHQKEHPNNYSDSNKDKGWISMERKSDIPKSIGCGMRECNICKNDPRAFHDWSFDQIEHMYVVDEAPFWSRKIIEAIGFGPTSFTDVWTLALENTLWHKHNLNRTVFLETPTVKRYLGPMDEKRHPRWTTDRRTNFKYVASEDFRNAIEKQADTVANLTVHESHSGV